MSDITITESTQICFRDSTDFSPAAGTSLVQGTPTYVQLALASVAAGAARQSDKFDFGANRAPSYSAMGAIEFASGVVAGEVVDLYLAFSPDSTAANGNPGGVSGSDAAYTGTSASTVAESINQLTFIGSFIATDDATATVQVSDIGSFAAKERYATLVVVNNTTPAFHSDDVEIHIVFNPSIPNVA